MTSTKNQHATLMAALQMAANYLADGLDERDETEMRLYNAIRNALEQSALPRGVEYRYERSTYGGDESFEIIDPQGKRLVSVPFWERAGEAEAKARLITQALNLHAATHQVSLDYQATT